MEVSSTYIRDNSNKSTTHTAAPPAAETTPAVSAGSTATLVKPTKTSHREDSEYTPLRSLLKGRTPSRIRLRKKLLFFSIPLHVILLLLTAKFFLLIPASRHAAEHFDQKNPQAMSGSLASMRFLFTTTDYIPDMAAGDKAALEHNYTEAETDFQHALDHGGENKCPIIVNLVIVKEAIAEIDVLLAHFNHSIHETADALTLLKKSPDCLEDKNDTNKDRQNYLSKATDRLTQKHNQADQGTLFYAEVQGQYLFDYMANAKTKEIQPTGIGHPCAGLADIPKRDCIIHNPNNKKPPPPPPPPPSSGGGGGGGSGSSKKDPEPPPTKAPPTSKQPPTKLDSGPPEKHDLNRHQSPRDALGDWLSNGAGRNHTNQ